MRVGVTGGTGLVGQYLLRDYSDQYDFVVPTRGYKNVCVKGKSISYVECDYHIDSLKKVFDGCDAVIHLASNKDTINQVSYIQNIQLGSNVLQACKELNIKNIVNVSSRAVWQNHVLSNKAQDEESITQPENLYGLGKLCVDTIADFYNQKYGMNIKTYRIGEICGLDLNKGMVHAFWKNMLLCSVEKKELPVYGTGMGGGRDLIYVKDVTRALIFGIENENVSGVFNIGQGNIVTNLEIANSFCEVFSNQAGIKLCIQEVNGGTEWNMDIEKAKQRFGFETSYDLLSIVRDIKFEYEKMLKRK